MKYSFDEIHALNMLSDNPEYSKRFNTPRDLKVVTLVILAALLVVLTVAIVFKVDKIVPAKGILETQAELFAVRNNQQGKIAQVHVKEGDQVKGGDILVRFDTRLLDLDIEALQQNLTSLSRNLWSDYYQLQPVLTDTELKPLAAQLQTIALPLVPAGWQQTLMAPIEQSLAQNQQTQQDTQLQLQQQQQQFQIRQQALSMDTEQLQSINNLYQKQIESRVNLQRQQRQVLDSQSNLDNNQASIEQLQLGMQKLITDRNKLVSEYQLTRIERFYNNLDNYQQTLIELAKQQRLRADMLLRAPIEGTVDGVAIKGAGEFISANSTLITLRPLFNKGDLLIEIQIPSAYAVWVEPGMSFRASAQGNNPDDHGYINGVVNFVSNSTSEAKQGEGRSFRMLGKITEFDLSARGLEPAFLRPGLELNVEVKAGKRRLINYIFDPFTKHFRTAFSEPG